nr:PIN domain-containing protein [Ornithinimicrobium cryptoxanthini]
MALVRLADSPDAQEWAGRIHRDLVRVTNVTRLEIGYSARNEDDARSLFAAPPVAAMPVEYLTPTIEDRALQVQLLLAGRGLRRAPSIPDLFIAAAAELAGLSVLHLDKEFDLIASITDQRAERLHV